MAKATLLENTEHHGKWKDGKYISQIPGRSPQHVSIKSNPNQPNTKAQQTHQQVAKSSLIAANAYASRILHDPVQRAEAQARFDTYCAEHGDTLPSKRTGKPRKRRLIDFLRKEGLITSASA